MNKPTLALAVALAGACAGVVRAQVDVPTANYDNERTSEDLNEGILNTVNVNPGQFGKLYAYPVDGQVYAQPLYVHALSMPSKGTLNVLYVATMHNSVYAFDADATAGTAPLWQVSLGPSVDPASFNIAGAAPYTDILHEIGILGTPVIDRAGNTIYVANETVTDGGDAFYLHALDLATGSEKLNGPVLVQAAVPGTGWAGQGDGVNGELPLVAGSHLQRTGLLLANGAVYMGFGSHGDYPPWHGWIVAYSAANLQQQTAVFSTTASTAGSAIWQGGRGLAADENGNVYCSTGNGNYDGVASWGESVLRLTPALEVADWFTPAEYVGWNDDDVDFGSNGPILAPGTNLLIGGGKAGLVALVDRNNMGHELEGDTEVLQAFQAVPSGQFAIFNAALWNRPDGPLFYVWGFQDALREFQMQNGVFNPTALAANSKAPSALPFSGLTVTSNGFVPGSGILWATTASLPNLPAAGTLHAFDAMDVSHELWNSDMQGSRDTLGNFTKFANPTVANGKVYVPTDSGQVAVYGLLPVAGIQAVVNAASFSSSVVAPGELITVFGVGIGPAAAAGLKLDAQGQVSTSLAGYQVTFNGEPAPLLYVSPNQINAVAPFALAGKSSAVVQVSTSAGARYAASVPVGAAAPGIFAIANGNFSLNSAAHPAARGSAVAIYATGTGPLSPAVADGTVIRADSLPVSAAPVSVTIGGVPAAVSYQGAAPGFVAGVMQINAQVPAGAATGSAVPVTIGVGGTAGLNTIFMAVN